MSESRNSSRGAASAMKSDGLGAANKPGDGQTSKVKKKPADRTVAAKAKTASAVAPVVNGTGAAARRDAASANGPRSSAAAKEHDKKPNPGARPKTSPPSGSSAGQTAGAKAQKSSAGKADNTTQAPPNASPTSGSASPENGASSPPNDSAPGSHSLLLCSHHGSRLNYEPGGCLV